MTIKKGINLLVQGVEVISDPGIWVVARAYPIPRLVTSPALPLYLKLTPDCNVMIGDKISDRDPELVIGGSMNSTFHYWEVAKIIDEESIIQLLNTIWEISRVVDDKNGGLWKDFQELIWDSPGFASANLI